MDALATQHTYLIIFINVFFFNSNHTSLDYSANYKKNNYSLHWPKYLLKYILPFKTLKNIHLLKWNISAHFGLNFKTTAENFSSSFGFRYPSIINSRLIFQKVVTSGFKKSAVVSNATVSFDTIGKKVI